MSAHVHVVLAYMRVGEVRVGGGDVLREKEDEERG